MLKQIFGSERSFARDFVKASFAIIFFATLGANLIAFNIGDDGPKIQTVAATDTSDHGVRTYSEVRSVLDDDVVTGTARSQLGQSQLNRISLDPCKR